MNITSIHGHAGFPRHAAYAATKGAINAFTCELAVELIRPANLSESSLSTVSMFPHRP